MPPWKLLGRWRLFSVSFLNGFVGLVNFMVFRWRVINFLGFIVGLFKNFARLSLAKMMPLIFNNIIRN